MRRSLAVVLVSALAAAPVFAGFEAETLAVPSETQVAGPLAPPAAPIVAPQAAFPRLEAPAPAAAPLASLNAGAAGLADVRRDKTAVLTRLYEKPGATPIDEADAPMTFLEARDALRILSRKAGLERAPDLRLDRREPENAVAEIDHLGGGASISVGPLLLLNSSRREMNVILAHELGHVAGKGRRIALGLAAPALLAQALPILAWAAWGAHASMPYALALGGILSAWTLFHLYSGHAAREEFAADAFAARLTGDPETLAGILEKWRPEDPLSKTRAARLRAMKTAK